MDKINTKYKNRTKIKRSSFQLKTNIWNQTLAPVKTESFRLCDDIFMYQLNK